MIDVGWLFSFTIVGIVIGFLAGYKSGKEEVREEWNRWILKEKFGWEEEEEY